VDYDAHPDPEDARRSLVLHWTHLFMIALLAGTFLFFWVHTLLWWRRSYQEICRERKGGYSERHLTPECRDEKQIQRFSIKERVMHVLLILSFLPLVMTGFP
jgi:hypothetical protein